jgi:triosephosphate isomerase
MPRSSRRPLIAGNWKMNGLVSSLSEIDRLAAILKGDPAGADVLVCPPATLLAQAAERAAGTAVAIGGQNCHAAASGAHTGELSAEMLGDCGCTHVIVGHSERRRDFGETDASVLAKALAAKRAGLVAVVCIGETEAERDQGHTLAVLGQQVAECLPDTFEPSDVVIAYEPVWAIGTGKTPTLGEIAAAHAFIREKLRTHCGAAAEAVRVLYGGSVRASNAKEILSIEDVDGALVGGASLKLDDFLPIVRAA